MSKFIHIRSSKFPMLPDEQQEMVDEGMVGKALAEYLQSQLASRGYDAPFVCCEDWGWWVELKDAPFAFGVCVYSKQEDDFPTDFACTDGAPGTRKWSWRQLRFLETSPWVEKLHEDMLATFVADEEVEVLGVPDEFPF